MVLQHHAWTSTGRILQDDAHPSVCRWTGGAGDRNVEVYPGVWEPYHWDGYRLRYGGTHSVIVEDGEFIFFDGVTEIARARATAVGRVPDGHVVTFEGGDRGASLSIRTSFGGDSIEHVITTNCQRAVSARIVAEKLGGQPVIPRIKHRAFRDDWAIRWKANEHADRTTIPGSKGRGILHRVAANDPRGNQYGRVHGTDEPGGELSIQFPPTVFRQVIDPDTYGPANAESAYECNSSSVGTPTIYSTDQVFLDEGDVQYQVGTIFRDVTFSGTVTSATLYLTRPEYTGYSDTSANDRTVTHRVEDAQDPNAYSSGNPWSRTYLATEVDYTFGADNDPDSITVTTLIQALQSEGYTYSGSNNGIHIAGAASEKGWSSYYVSFVTWGNISTVPTLEIDYTTSSELDFTAAVTIGSPTVAASMELPNDATVGATLGSPTVAASMELPNDATVGATLGSPTVAASMELPNDATVAATLGSPTVAASMELPNDATVAVTLGPVLVEPAFNLPNDIVGAVTLAGPVVAGSVALPNDIVGSATLGPVGVAAEFYTPGSDVNFSVGVTLGALTVDGSVELPNDIVGSATLGPVGVAASMALPNDIVGSATLGSPAVAASVELPNDVSVATTLGTLTVAASMTSPNDIEGAIVLGGVAVGGAMELPNDATVGATLGGIAVEGSFGLPNDITLAMVLGAIIMAEPEEPEEEASMGFQDEQNLGPKIGQIACIAITASSVAHSLETEIGLDVTNRMVMIVPSIACWYAFGGSGDSIDETAESGATQCAYLAANVAVKVIPTGTHVIVKGGTTGYLRIWPASDG